MIPLAGKEVESYASPENRLISKKKKKLKKKMLMMKSIVKLEILVIAQVNTEVLYITYVI